MARRRTDLGEPVPERLARLVVDAVAGRWRGQVAGVRVVEGGDAARGRLLIPAPALGDHVETLRLAVWTKRRLGEGGCAMTTDEHGSHESLIGEAIDFFIAPRPGPAAHRVRGRARGRSVAPAASGCRCPSDVDPDPPVRWSPAARRGLRCDDHAGHLQTTFRLRAQRPLDSEDLLWRAWHALAESRGCPSRCDTWRPLQDL